MQPCVLMCDCVQLCCGVMSGASISVTPYRGSWVVLPSLWHLTGGHEWCFHLHDTLHGVTNGAPSLWHLTGGHEWCFHLHDTLHGVKNGAPSLWHLTGGHEWCFHLHDTLHGVMNDAPSLWHLTGVTSGASISMIPYRRSWMVLHLCDTLQGSQVVLQSPWHLTGGNEWCSISMTPYLVSIQVCDVHAESYQGISEADGHVRVQVVATALECRMPGGGGRRCSHNEIGRCHIMEWGRGTT